jgi:hypothetical protein
MYETLTDSDIIFKSTRSLYRMAFNVVCGVLFAVAAVVLFSWAGINVYNHQEQGTEVLILLIATGCIAGAIWLGYKVFTGPATVIIDKESLRIADRVVHFNTIDYIKHKAFDIRHYDREMIVIKLYNGDHIFIYIDQYKNGTLLRAVCGTVKDLIAKRIYVLHNFDPPLAYNPYAIPSSQLAGETFKKYPPNYGTIVLYILYIFFIYAFVATSLIANTTTAKLIAAFFLLMLLFLILRKNLNSILISPSYLVIRNRFSEKGDAVFAIKSVRRCNEHLSKWAIILNIMADDYVIHKFQFTQSNADIKEVEDAINKYRHITDADDAGLE